MTTEPGKQVRRQAAEALRLLGDVAELQLFASRKWLGTVTGARLIVLGKPTKELTSWLLGRSSIFYPVGDHGGARQVWEDLALYRGGRVLLWTCTHEEEGVIYASESQLRAWHLRASASVVPRIEAEKLSSEASGDIVLQARGSDGPAPTRADRNLFDSRRRNPA